MNPEDEDDAAVAAEYVLGLLTSEEATAFEARMQVDPPFRALVAEWSEHLVRLADAIPEVAPPLGVEAAITRRLFPEERRGLLRRLGIVPALLGGLVAALLVLWAGDRGLLRPQQGTAYAAELASEDRSLVVDVRFDPAEGSLVVAREAGAVADGRSQELWLIPEGQAPISLGVLDPAGESRVRLPEALVSALPGATIAISDEPPGGSPVAGPTGDVLAAGVVTTL